MLSPSERSMRAQIAANTRWSKEDPAQQVAVLRRGFFQKFLDQVDPNGVLPEAERVRRAESAMRAHMLKLSFKAAKARRGDAT